MIHLKAITKQNPFDAEGTPKYYASAIHNGKSDVDSLATEIAERCSLRRSDVYGTLIALMDIIPQELLNGKVVSLGELGTFFLSVKSDGVQTEDELTPRIVKGVKIQYRPTKRFRNKVQNVDVNFKK